MARSPGTLPRASLSFRAVKELLRHVPAGQLRAPEAREVVVPSAKAEGPNGKEAKEKEKNVRIHKIDIYTYIYIYIHTYIYIHIYIYMCIRI